MAALKNKMTDSEALRMPLEDEGFRVPMMIVGVFSTLTRIVTATMFAPVFKPYAPRHAGPLSTTLP